jgi:hypothetical protein
MSRAARTAVVLLLAASASLGAVDFLLFPFDRELSAHVQGYYLSPRPEAALDRFFQMSFAGFVASAAQKKQVHARATLLAFYAQILRRNPGLVLPFATRLVGETSGAHAAFGTEVLALGAVDNRLAALNTLVAGFGLSESAAARYRELGPFDYLGMTVDHPQELDVVWACFFATGDERFLAALAVPLDDYEAPGAERRARLQRLATEDPKALVAALTAQGAFYSFQVNARQHPPVRAFLESLAAAGDSTRARTAKLALLGTSAGQ